MPQALIGAAIGVGGQVAGGLFGKKAAKKAAAARQAAITKAGGQIGTSLGDSNNALSSAYDQGRADLQGYQDIGHMGLAGLSDPNTRRNFGVGDFYEDPGYQFVLEQGQRGIQNGASARGGLLSGATQKALTRFNQGTAAQQYQNSFDRFNQNRSYQTQTYGGMAQMGQKAADQVGQWGYGTGVNTANNYTNYGNSMAGLDLMSGNVSADLFAQKNSLNQGMIGGVANSLSQMSNMFK